MSVASGLCGAFTCVQQGAASGRVLVAVPVLFGQLVGEFRVLETDGQTVGDHGPDAGCYGEVIFAGRGEYLDLVGVGCVTGVTQSGGDVINGEFHRIH